MGWYRKFLKIVKRVSEDAQLLTLLILLTPIILVGALIEKVGALVGKVWE